MIRPVYLDNAATTRLDPRVLEAMLPYLTDRYGNPASRTHAFGWEAEEAVESARREVAAVIGADPSAIAFVSGATEADHLALRGAVGAYRTKGRHLIVSAIEHSAVLEAAESLERHGCEVTRLPVDRDGRVAPDQLAAAIRPDTVLASIMAGNNEIGTQNDLPALGAVCRERGVIFHTDATQAFGRVGIEVDADRIDLLSCSAHKVHGPKGVGALFVRRRGPRVALEAQQRGGGQEGGLRAGSLNVPGIVGFGAAARLLREESTESARIAALRDRLEQELLASIPGAYRNGGNGPRLPGITNLGIDGLEAEALLLSLRGLALSTGSACASASLEPSHVLLAIGRGPFEARNSLRLSLGRFTTAEEIDRAVEEVRRAVTELRSTGAGC
ncbi:MAG: cysteine desulfurase [Candidatus Eisenbacteria bacterium]|nr:cysteine desulfurase [Candidatus Eisenbacteria bacterium]